MIVVDTNVIAALYLPTASTLAAEAALRRDPAWAAPRLWRSEFGNVLATSVRLKKLPLADAQAALDAAMTTLAGGEFDVVPSTVLQLAADSGCSAYDCEFVALALDLGVSLVTVDAKLLAAFPDSAVSLDHFAAADDG